ncbi:SusD/RagB family nutrient-binding outer membrane lipoprotein [Rhodohalobacter sp. 8-1]|uniref:SusD/RagB family nutrient-binding outer membrane lipoprotein n=1 Tax=Rhodohalobacter sp. 8-1 TaxID=3131972 RepID=UPI0030EE50C9
MNKFLNKMDGLTMENLNIKAVIVSLVLIVSISACTDHFSSLNTPPTSVTSIDPDFIFTEVLRDDNINYNWEYADARLFGGWAQHWADNDAGDGLPNYYQQHRRNDNAFWEVKYVTVLKNLNRAKALVLENAEGDASSPAARSKLAMIKLYEAMTYETLAAGLGDIPFSEANKGLEGITNPVYDLQSNIYPALIDTIDTYMAQLTSGDATFQDADIIYQGDIDMWRRFANSLKLKIAMRMSYANEAAAEAAVTEAMGDPLISSNEESAMIATTAGGGPDANAHPILTELREPGDKSRIGMHLVEMLKANDDPRLEFIAEPTEASKDVFEVSGDPNDLEYLGIPPNMTDAQYNEMDLFEISYAALDIWANEDLAVPAHVLTYPEVLFLQAEAALRGWGGTLTEAQLYYEEGIRAAMTMEPYNNTGFNGVEITEADINAYVASQLPLSADFETALEQISEDRYVALFSRGDEPYFEWRRTGYPLLDPGTRTDNYTNGNIPRKAFYHESEQSLNNENWQEAGDRQGDDGYNAEIWLDQNPNNGQLYDN